MIGSELVQNRGGDSSYKGVYASLDDANTNGVSNTEGDYVIIYEVGIYTFEEGDIIIEYNDPSTVEETLGVATGSGMYSTTSLGIAATSPGEYFVVTTDGGLTFTSYINSAGSPFATGLTGDILPAYDATVVGGLVVPLDATRTAYNTAVFHKGEYKYTDSGYKGVFANLSDANVNGIRNKEGDYVSISIEGSGFTLSEGDLFTVYQDPDTLGTTLDSTFNNRPMYSSTTIGQANTGDGDYYLVQNNATTATAYQNFGAANFVDNITIDIEYNVAVNGKLAVPQTGINPSVDYGLATYNRGQYEFVNAKITQDERNALTPTDGMELYCTDCLDNGGDVGVKQVYQESEATWKNLY